MWGRRFYGEKDGPADNDDDVDEPRMFARGSSGVHTCANSLQPGMRSPLRCQDNEWESPPSGKRIRTAFRIQEYIISMCIRNHRGNIHTRK